LRTISVCAERFRTAADCSAARSVRLEYATHVVDAPDAGDVVAVMLADTSPAAPSFEWGHVPS